MDDRVVRAAAIQLQPVLGDVDANLAAAHGLVAAAAKQGARLVVLPEFFTSGMAYLPAVADAIEPWSGRVIASLRNGAAAHDVLVAGSFLCLDDDGHVRNAFVVVSGHGVLGRHDKDLPTMWENAMYAPGSPLDTGLIDLPDGTTVGAAMCWELIRTQTVRRLAGRVDVVLAGSAWWSVPPWRPRLAFSRWERRNQQAARRSVTQFARFVGAPVIHASLSGSLACTLPAMPGRYSGHYEGPTAICDASGIVLAERAADEGPGVVVADVPFERRRPEQPPDRFWTQARGPIAAFSWSYQRRHGRREYARRFPAPSEQALPDLKPMSGAAT